MRVSEFILLLDGQPWKGWEEIEVTRAIDRMSGAFSVKLAKNKEDGDISLQGGLQTGMTAEVEIDGQIVLSGYLFSAQYEYDARDVSIEASGRDRTSDLIDCAAAVDGAHDFINRNLTSIVSSIAAPYGIAVRAETDVGRPFTRAAVQPGETAFEFIDRLCRQRGVLCISDGVGGLVIVRPAALRSKGILIYGDNIIAGSVTHDASEMFSLYVVKGQAEPMVADTEASATVTPSARVSDAAVKRYRPKVIIAEAQGYEMTLAERAAWEKMHARAQSKRASYTVQGWYADPDMRTLWRPNTIVPVVDERAGLFKRDMLISGVSYRRDSSGTVTVLDLVMPDAFDLPAESEAKGGKKDIWVNDD